jgi:hypothetical protein
VLFLVACLATVLAVTIRSRFARQTGAPEMEAGHAVLVQDAEMFRESIKAAASGGQAPEAAFVIGVALPNHSETLEVTVKNEWGTLDSPTRLSYAAKLDQRWKAIHAPHRAAFSILDEAGKEIGGRSWQANVWVIEESENTSQSAPAPMPAATPAEGANAVSGNVANSASTPIANGTAANGTSSTNPQPAIAPPSQATPAPDDADGLSNIETQ